MFGLQELLESTIEKVLVRENLEHLSLDELSAMDKDMMPRIVDVVADILLESLMKKAPSQLRGHQRDRKGFEKRLRKRWKSPLDQLDLFICLARDASNELGIIYVCTRRTAPPHTHLEGSNHYKVRPCARQGASRGE